MPRRNLIPFVLLAILLILALAFAVIGQTSSPNRASLAVQNATSATFGDPAGSNSFTMNLSASLSSSLRAGSISQERLITYRAPRSAPSRLTVYERVGARTVRLAVLGPGAIPCVLSSYASIVGGATTWSANGNTYTRDESLAEFSARVPHSSATSCVAQPSAVHGSVAERAILRSGYLVDLTLIVSVPAQRLANGTPASHGIEGERLQFLTIGGTAVAQL